MTAEQIEDAILDEVDELIEAAEAELGRELTDEERESLVEEFLADLDTDDEPEE